MTSDVPCSFAGTSGVPDMNRTAKIEVRHDRGSIARVVVHIVARALLSGSTVTAAVVGNDAVALAGEVEHLGIPVVRTERPAMVKDDRLSISWAPILIEDLKAL